MREISTNVGVRMCCKHFGEAKCVTNMTMNTIIIICKIHTEKFKIGALMKKLNVKAKSVILAV